MVLRSKAEKTFGLKEHFQRTYLSHPMHMSGADTCNLLDATPSPWVEDLVFDRM